MAGPGGGTPSAMTALPSQAAVAPSCPDLLRNTPREPTTVGAAGGWDPATRAAVEVVLSAPVPMAFAYGPDYLLIYNDAFANLIGGEHPAAFGRPAAEVFGELWQAPGVGAVIEDVFHTGRPYLEAETLVALPRGDSGRVEQAFFTRGHSVVGDRQGRVAGAL